MGFKRREGLAGGLITKYADEKLKCCPFCGSKEPHWLTDAYIANYSLISANCVNGYKFQCEKCQGVFEIQGKTDFCFTRESFVSIKLLSVGSGNMNADKIEVPLTIDELKELCNGSAEALAAPVVEEASMVEEEKPANKYCPKCGTVANKEQKFCVKCGCKLDESVSTNTVEVTPEPIPTPQPKVIDITPEVQPQKVIDITPVKNEPSEGGVWPQFATLGFVFGLIAMCCALFPFVNFMSILLGAVGTVFSALGFKSISKKSNAIMGLIFSIVGLVVGFILFVVYIALFTSLPYYY